ncbi:MAG: hypothetical protein AAB566_00095 [Patescibacteria group bacterium]
MLTNNPELNKLLAQAGDAYDFLSGFDYPLWLSDLKAVLTYVSVIFAFLLAVIIFKIRRLAANRIKEELADLKDEFNPPAEAVSAYDRRWEEVKKHVNSFNEAEWKLAVIEADKFTDDALKTGGYPGESMGERLMLIQPGQLLSLQNLWDAHKLRNLLVHDANYKLTHRQAVLAVEAFEQVLRELGALS